MFRTALASAVAAVLVAGAAHANPGYVTEDLNLRTGPSVRYEVITALPGCSRIHVYESYNGWYHATWNGIEGWVSARFVSGDPDDCYRPRYQPPPRVYQPPREYRHERHHRRPDYESHYYFYFER